MMRVPPKTDLKGTVCVPGSKSLTHRALIAAALSDGVCRIENALRSEDTGLTLAALKKLGAGIAGSGDAVEVSGTAGRLEPVTADIDLHNSGTSMRLLTAVAAIGSGAYTLSGSARMQARPIQDLTDALGRLGVQISCLSPGGCPPVRVTGGAIDGGAVTVNCGLSSQFLSALLLIGPYTAKGLDIQVIGGPVSRPYIDLTVEVMSRFGVDVQRQGYRRFQVPGGKLYRCARYTVEPDCSQAGYFWTAAAITGGSVKVLGTRADTLQGDFRLVRVLADMGCSVSEEADGVRLTGGRLRAVDVDMADMPDMVPTLAVAAAFARGTTCMRSVAHLRRKESDRLAAVVAGLGNLGIRAVADADTLTVWGGNPRGAPIDPHDDHRIAMSFALAGLKVPGVGIENESCVAKSFPSFWQVLAELCRP